MERKKPLSRPLLVSLFMCMFVFSQAQVTINVMVPNGGLYLKSQLWNLSVISTYATPINGQIRVEMKDIQTHETVLSAISASFMIPPGAKVIQDRFVQPIQYNFGPGSIDQSPNGMLPVGQYQVCYQLYLLPHAGTPVIIADDCVQLQVEPLSPPLLTMPEDSARIETSAPVFTWMPPAPLGMFGSLNYDFLLTEVFVGQSATDALQKNLPQQQALALRQPFLQYPLQSQQLEKGKLYAWQVTARDGSRYAAKSETWVFRLQESDAFEKILSATPFVQIKKEGSQLALAPNGVLKFVYDHRPPGDTIMVSIKDISAANPGASTTFNLLVHAGSNYIQEPIKKHATIQDGRIYMAELVNASKEHYYLRFEVKDIKN